MSTAQIFFPGRFYSQGRRTLDRRALLLLFAAVAICCAAIVFVVLYNLDQRFPVAEVHTPATAVLDVTPTNVPLVTAGATSISTSSTTKLERRTIRRAEPIAHTHGELLALEQLGERNYVEFSVAKSSSFQPVGPIQIGFWRSDSKRASVQMSILLEKRRIDLKSVRTNERVSLIAPHSQPLELVINSATRNQITGYLSEPRTLNSN